MYATVCRQFSAPLTHERWPDLVPAADEICVAVEAAGVSFANTVVVAGQHQNTPELPFIPGTELAGTIVATGRDARGVKPGDRVMASVRSGAFATHILLSPDDVYPIPHDMDPSVACSLPTLYGTALGALSWRARLQPEQFLLVHGAGSGTGLAAVDIGRSLGARVIACAGSDDKLSAAAARGAECLINHRTDDLREKVLSFTCGHGADVVYDPVGGEVFKQSLRCTAVEGVILTIGFASGVIPTVALNYLLVKNITVSGFYWGFHLGIGRVNAGAEVRQATRKMMAELVDAVSRGGLAPLVSAEYALEDANIALQAVLDRTVVGRVTLRL